MRANYDPIPSSDSPRGSYQRSLQPLDMDAPTQQAASSLEAYDRRRKIVQTVSVMFGTVALVLLVVALASQPAAVRQKGAPVEPMPAAPSEPRLAWGIVGAGRISHEFAVGLKVLGANVTAVAAGSLPKALSRAEIFAATFGVPKAYGSYEELAKDPAVQVVYIGTTNHLHYNNTMLMLSHGKHVVCEKPLAMDENEAKEMIALARKKNLLLLTNYWTRWFPAMKFAREVVNSRELGDIISVRGDFSFQAVPGIKSTERFFSRKLGGGAMHDMGSYLVQFSLMFLFDNAEQVDVQASSIMSDERIDLETVFVLSHKDKTAQFGTSLRRPSDYDIEVFGTHGKLRIHTPGNCPTNASYAIFQDATKETQTPIPCCGQPVITAKEFYAPLPEYPTKYGDPQYPRGTGFVYVIEAVEKCLNEGCSEMPGFSYDEQLEIVRLSDKILKEIGYL